MLTIYIPSIAKYWHLAPAFMPIFNKYWPDQKCVYLCYDKVPDIEMPPNFSKVYIGSANNYKDWTSPLISFMQDVDTPYFVIAGEDMFPTSDTNMSELPMLVNEIRSGQVDKVILEAAPDVMSYTDPYKPGMRKLRQDIRFRYTLQPSIWTKEYFLRHIRPGWTIWDYEKCKQAVNDGATIITLEAYNMLFTLELYRGGGRLVGKSLRRLCPEDRALVDACNPATR